jgi:hypothetical protein
LVCRVFWLNETDPDEPNKPDQPKKADLCWSQGSV